MRELLEQSFTPANLVPTIFLVLTIVYWLVFLVGLLDLHFLDFHIDHDIHADAGYDASHGTGGGKDFHKDVHPDGSGFGFKVLDFFNLGHVPFMVFFSFFSLFFWAASVIGNHYWAKGTPVLILAVLGGGMVGALLLTKVATQPLRKLFKRFKDEEEVIDFHGAICTIEIGPEGKQLGQAVLRHATKSITISVRSESGEKIPHGTQCVILEKAEGQEYYMVAPLETEAAKQ
jgi:hypothetical protein